MLSVSPAGVLALFDTKRPLSSETGATANGRCLRYSGRTPLETRFAGPVTASARLELVLSTQPAGQVAPKQPAGEPSPFLFRLYEAAVRDLTDPVV